MNDLVKALVEGLIDVNESTNKKIVGMFGGGFKPPTSGHLEVVQRALAENPELDELIILVGSGTRDSISQEESLAIWNIYKKLLPSKVTVMASPKDKPPIGAIYSYAKKNPNEIIYWFVGAREGNEEDFQDIEKRTRSLRKLAYQNVKVKQIVTGGAVSGTKARQALLAKDKETFLQFIPDIPEVDQIWDMLTAVVKERIAFTPDFVTQGDVEFVDDFADRKLAPIDVDLTGNHFFDRLNDPRNRPDISVEELEEFFDKLADEKEDFIKFLKQYKDVVVKDTDTNINIPFMKRANKAIAKTIMRKKNFMTSNKVLPLEEGRYDNEVLTQSRYIINLFKAEFSNEFKDEEAGGGNIGDKKYKLQLAFVPTTLTSGADFEIDGFAYPKTIAINIAYNPEAFPEAYNELIAGVKDTVRHELEHFGQYHFDKDAEVDVPEEDYPSRFEYLTDDYEVSAHVQGLYKKAKTKKVSFTDVLEDFLDDELDTLSPKEIKLIRNQYMWYAKNNLPAAQINEADPKKGTGKNQKYYKALQLAKTLKSTTNLNGDLKEDLTPQILSLTQYMASNGLNLKPYPKVKFIDNDGENANNLLGRTAYYDPNQQLIALYTMGRHPKDILRSYAHELVHHHQNLNNTLDHGQTTNTNEDDALDRIEREAYENGNILFRNWEDSIKN